MDLTRIKSRSGAPFTVAGPYADRFQGLLYDLEDAGYAVNANQSGGYNPRNIRGTNTPSQHSSGRAVDINWTDNPRGARGKIPADLARDLAKKHGMVWGGDWKNPDDMHFEVARDGPVPMAERGLTSFAGLGAPPPATPTEPELPPMLIPGSTEFWNQNRAKKGEPELPPMMRLGGPEPEAPSPQAGQPPQSLWESIMNPMTLAGLSILGSPTRDVGQGMQAGLLAQQRLDKRQDQQRELLDPMRDLERRHKEALIEKLQREASGAAGAPNYGVSPVYGVDANGRPVIMQMGNDGSIRRPDLPQGVTPLGPGETAEARASGNMAGKTRAQALADLPRAEAAGERMLRQLDAVIGDQNLPNVTGWEAFLPTFQPKNVDTEERLAQLSGGAFLQAFESLKGGGQITEIEGKKATDALARLSNLKQSDAGYMQALKDFRTEVENLIELARHKAGVGGAAPDGDASPSSPSPAQPGTPAVGTVMQGYRFKGGNPSDPNSWERQ